MTFEGGVTVIMRKNIFKKYTFLVYSDGTYQQITDKGLSDFAPDFADTFLKLYADGFRQV